MNNLEVSYLSLASLILILVTIVIVIFMKRDHQLRDLSNSVLYAFITNTLASVLILSMLVVSIIGRNSAGIIISVISLAGSIGSLLSITVAYTTEAYEGVFLRWTNNHFMFSFVTWIALVALFVTSLFG